MPEPRSGEHHTGRQGPSPGAPAGVPPWVWTWGSPTLAVLAVAVLPVAAATTDLDDLGGWGLAVALSPFGWIALALAVAGCVVEVTAPRVRNPVLAMATGVLVLCSTGLPSVLEPKARFTTAWLHSGFVDSIAGDGIPPSGVDARFYWPAFFAQWAFFQDAAGAGDLDLVLRWFPPVVVAVWALGVYAIARSVLGGSRVPWVAAWLFVGLNWIEQDYFSPQATGIVLQLTVLACVFGPLATRRVDQAGVAPWPEPRRGAPRPSRWRRWLVCALTPPNSPAPPANQLLLVYFCVALCLLAIAPTHQLTPFAIIGQLVVLAVVGRFRGRGLVLVATLAVTVYILIETREFWTYQIDLIVGRGLSGGGALESGVLSRLTGDTGQVAVKLLRIVVPGLTWLLAIVGAWVYWKRHRDLVPIALAAVPLGFVAVQSYGGELFLRIMLFALPMLAVLCAEALRSFARRAGHRRTLLLAVGMGATFATLILVRGGNEAYSQVTPRDVEMTRLAFAQVPPNALVQPLGRQGPYGLTGIGEHNRAPNIDECARLSFDPIRCIGIKRPYILLIYPSIEMEGVVLNGKPPGWTLRVVDELVSSGQYRVTYRDGFDVTLQRIAP